MDYSPQNAGDELEITENQQNFPNDNNKTDDDDNSSETPIRSRPKRIRNKPQYLNLTPLGLPKKSSFQSQNSKVSLHDLYTNNNFIEPPAKSLETIYEEIEKESTKSVKKIQKIITTKFFPILTV